MVVGAVNAPTVLALLALLVPTAGADRGAARGWFVRFADDPWAYAPITDEARPTRTRPATFLHLGDDGTALQLIATVSEETYARGRPGIVGEGFAIWAGTWRRGASGGIEVELDFRVSSNVVFTEAPGARKFTATIHGRHLLTDEGPLVPLTFAYPADAAPLRKALFETCCSTPGRDAACRTIRR
jgi:hypothetical protein